MITPKNKNEYYEEKAQEFCQAQIKKYSESFKEFGDPQAGVLLALIIEEALILGFWEGIAVSEGARHKEWHPN